MEMEMFLLEWDEAALESMEDSSVRFYMVLRTSERPCRSIVQLM